MDRINDWVGAHADTIKLAIVAALMAVLAYVGVGMGLARAEGIGKASPVPVGEVARASTWTGVGIGVYGAWLNADADVGPFNIGMNAPSAGISVSIGAKMGAFVLEGFGEYGWVFGDLHDLGVDNEMAAGIRAGFLVSPQTLVYAVGAKAWIDTSAGMFDGWQYGGGVKMHMKGTPTFLSLEYRRAEYDIHGLDVTADTVRAGFTYQFGLK
jgi:hypothetical protein